MSFALDHVTMSSPDAEAVARLVSEATGLAVLRGWTPGGEVRSWGVRFAGGRFLDIRSEAVSPALLGLAGPIDELEREAALRAWRVKVFRLENPPAPYLPPPWSVAAFRKGQGALSALFVIEYRPDDPVWAQREYSGELFRAAGDPPVRLERVTLAAPEGETAPALANLLPRGVEVRIGPAAEVVELRVSAPVAARTRVSLTPALTLVVQPTRP